MKFNFPDFETITERHDIYFKPSVWAEIVEISRRHKLEESKALSILLEAVLPEYWATYGSIVKKGSWKWHD